METKTTHTSGPWKLVGTEIWGPRFRLADGRGAYDEKDRAKRNANARLIAAAPELLAALTKAINETVNGGGRYYSEWITQARAAIAKAEGRK